MGQRAQDEVTGAKGALVQELKAHGTILGGFVALLWVIHFVNALVFGGGLAAFGVAPRTLSGLRGILFAPFLHGSLQHLVANTAPLLILGWFVMLRRKRDLLYVSTLAALVGGLGTWLIAPSASVHIGASGVIYGYLGYLLSRGIFEKRFWPILGSLAVFFLYGALLFGVFPGEIGVSWQGHLFGLVGGVLAARVLKSKTAAAPPAPKKRVAASLSAAPAVVAADDEHEDELAEMKRRLGR
jgi:membrane associated rhomboid family serine protease